MARLELLLRDSNTGARTAWFTAWQQFQCTRVVNGVGGYALVLGGEEGTMKDMIELRDLFALDTILEVWREDEEAGIDRYCEARFLHQDLRIWRDANGWHFMSVGVGYNDLLARTHVQAPAQTAQSIKSGYAESVLKAFVDQEAGAGAGSRARTDLSIEADGGGGTYLRNVNGFNTNLLALCQHIARIGGGDFDVVGDEYGTAELRWYDGQLGSDRRASVLFASEYNNLRFPSWMMRNTGVVNSVLVYGRGEGADRTRALVEDAASIALSKWNRREVGRDARDVDEENETEQLEQRGQELIEKNRYAETIDYQIVQTAGWMYGQHYYLGDLVSVRPLDVTYDRKIESVTITQNEGEPEIVEVGTTSV